MKTLLVAVNAKYIHSNLAVYDLRAYCRPYKEQIEIAEYTINQALEDILTDIYKKKPDIVAFSCYIWNIAIVCELGMELKKLLPDVLIWLGGPEVSYECHTFLEKESWAEGILVGEGEETFLELMQLYYDKKGTRKEIRGLVYRDETGIFANAPRPVLDLSQVPFIYEDVVLPENRIIYYETSRGCPFSCSYCLSSIEKSVRFRDLELVKNELMFFLKRRVLQVKLVDRTFNCNRKRARTIWQFLYEHDNGVTNFHFEVAADLLGEEELELLGKMRPGLVQLEIGVQSTNERTIGEIHRTMNLERLEHIVTGIREKENVHQHLDLIAGLPFEDYESFTRSFDRIYALKPQQLQLGFLKVLKGSYMYEHAKEYGLQYKSLPPYEVLYTKWISFDEMIILKSVEKMVEIYYNSGQFRHTLAYVMKLEKSAFCFYKSLAQFYEGQGIGMKSRMAKYELLLEFLSKRHVDDAAVFAELLTMDFYARENAKSRPAWAPDLSVYRERFHAFFYREETEHQFLKEYAGYQARQLSGMTHIEVFEHAQEKGRIVLFDYKKRHPITGEAAMYDIGGSMDDK